MNQKNAIYIRRSVIFTIFDTNKRTFNDRLIYWVQFLFGHGNSAINNVSLMKFT